MSRQSIAVTVVIAVLGLLLVARAMVGHGMGRVYSRTATVRYQGRKVLIELGPPVCLQPEL